MLRHYVTAVFRSLFWLNFVWWELMIKVNFGFKQNFQQDEQNSPIMVVQKWKNGQKSHIIQRGGQTVRLMKKVIKIEYSSYNFISAKRPLIFYRTNGQLGGPIWWARGSRNSVFYENPSAFRGPESSNSIKHPSSNQTHRWWTSVIWHRLRGQGQGSILLDSPRVSRITIAYKQLA